MYAYSKVYKYIYFRLNLLANIEPRGTKRGKNSYGNGKETLRFKANGATQIQKEVKYKKNTLNYKM